MAIPANAIYIEQPLDPADILDIEFEITHGDADAAALLLDPETVASFTLALTTEAAAAGLRIKSGGAPYPAPVIADWLLTFWLDTNPSQQAAAVFNTGLKLGLELTVTTTNTPPRVKQRTLVVEIAQQ